MPSTHVEAQNSSIGKPHFDINRARPTLLKKMMTTLLGRKWGIWKHLSKGEASDYICDKASR